jgi:hypothetical protein
MQGLGSGLLLLSLLSAAGITGADALLPSTPTVERRILGLAGGLALLITLAYFCTSAHVPLLTLPGLVLAAIGFALLRRSNRQELTPEPRLSVSGWIGLAVVYAVALVWFAIPVLARALPQGWDPAFHVAATEIIRTEGVVPTTWAPYEPAEKFDYPAALHCVMGLYARLSGLPSSTVFSITMVTIAALTLLLIYALGARFGEARGAGALALVLYGFTDGWGTLVGHAVWGGLPNMTGLALMWAMLLASLAPGPGGLAFTTICAIGIALLHHLSFAILGFTVVLAAMFELIVTRQISPPVRRAVAASFIALGTVGVLILLRPSGRFSIAEALHFDREGMLTIARMIEVVGWPVLGPGLAGLVLVWIVRDIPNARILAAWTMGLILFWLTWDWAYRWGANHFKHEDFTAFTPSRGITDAAVLLAVLGGMFLWRLVRELPAPAAWVGVAFGLALWHARPAEEKRLAEAKAATASAMRAEAFCRETREKTPANAVVFAPDFGEVGTWLPYLCARELNYFPDPGYAVSPYRQAKMNQRDPIAFSRLVQRDGPRPVYFATRRDDRRGKLVFRQGEWRLYDVSS